MPATTILIENLVRRYFKHNKINVNQEQSLVTPAKTKKKKTLETPSQALFVTNSHSLLRCEFLPV